jgi:hypothetical protein
MEDNGPILSGYEVSGVDDTVGNGLAASTPRGTPQEHSAA